MKRIFFPLLITSLCFSLSFIARADEENIPAPFRGDDPASQLEVAYNDLDAFLAAQVYVTGFSDRKKAPVDHPRIGTRLKVRVNRLTVMEGNRFFFEAFEDDNVVKTLSAIRKSLEGLPDEIPLSYLSKNEQLAYWLNLYNFTMLDELQKAYPINNIHDLLDPEEDEYILDDKVLTVAGERLSLADIQFTILKEKYDSNPLIIYGLFQGNIGGPSIQNRAFTGNNVWQRLKYSAQEFINSNRGTYYDGRVSEFYKHNLAFFNNDKTALRNHLLSYIRADFYDEIAQADELRMTMNDWQLASLLGNTRQFGGSVNTNGGAFLDSATSSQPGVAGNVSGFFAVGMADKAEYNFRLSPEKLAILKEMRTRHGLTRGKITVEDLDSAAQGNSSGNN